MILIMVRIIHNHFIIIIIVLVVQCETTIPKVTFCNNPDHLHYIEPSNVLQTLKKFVENCTQCKKG